MPAGPRSVWFGFVVLVAALALAGVAVPTSAAPADGSVGTNHTNETLPTVSNDITVEVSANGDAQWTERLRVVFDNQTTRADFEQIATEYENGGTRLLPIQRYRNASDRAGRDTGRSMAITDVARSTNVTDEEGTLVLSFTWTNFGEREDGDLSVSDVFAGDTGRWFPGLESFQRLTIRGPADYEIKSASQGFQNQTLRWSGPVAFGPNTPYVVYSPGSAGPPPTTQPPPTTAPGPSSAGDDGGLFVGALVLVVVGALAVVAYGATRRDGDLLPTPGGAADAGEATADEADESATPADGTDFSGAGAGAAAAAGEDESDEDDGIDEELLSDEERVERLLEQNGGRMKQANIVSETGWSNAKVSQLLSSMAEDERIEKLRIGRENLISFPDEDIVDESEQ